MLGNRINQDLLDPIHTQPVIMCSFNYICHYNAACVNKFHITILIIICSLISKYYFFGFVILQL